MKIASVAGMLVLTIVMIINEWQYAKSKKGKVVAGGITIAATALAIALLLYPAMPGPTQFVKLLFGKVDMFMK